jgi:hypothetical protein
LANVQPPRYDAAMHHRPAGVLPLLTLLPLLSLACGPKERTYSVAVRNGTERPITIGLAKEGGGPYEPVWAAPEEMAMEPASRQPDPRVMGRSWGVTVPPGKRGEAGPVKGTFGSGARAMLRVYSGDLTMPEVLAVSRGSPNRVDVELHEGANAYTIQNRGGKLVAEVGAGQ